MFILIFHCIALHFLLLHSLCFSSKEAVFLFWFVFDVLEIFTMSWFWCFLFLLAYRIVIFQTNGSAKLKQIKLDVRREQWLSRGGFMIIFFIWKILIFDLLIMFYFVQTTNDRVFLFDFIIMNLECHSLMCIRV